MKWDKTDILIPSTIYLSFCGKNLDPDKVSETIGFEPCMQTRRGEKMYPDYPRSRIATRGAWTIWIKGNQKPGLLLTKFTNMLRPYRKALATVRSWKTVDKKLSYVEISIHPSEKVAIFATCIRPKDQQFWSSLGFDISVQCWIPGWDRVQPEPNRKCKTPKKKSR
jgi:hypothetical protein